jgi:hypothetical protein
MIFSRLQKFREENGTAVTEFVMFLPVFVVTFAGIVNLGKFGYETTQTQILAQKKLWAAVIPITNGIADGGVHMSSTFGGGDAVGNLASLAGNSANPQMVADGLEGVVMAGLTADGHWGESYLRVKPFKLIGFANDVDPTLTAKDIIGEQPFPQYLLNDGANRPMPSGIMGVVASILSGTGALPAMAAGIRYGEVFGEESRNFNVGNVGSFNAQAHYDVLVAPSPLKGIATKMTFGFAWVFAQTDDNYNVMMTFGKSEWEGDSSGGSSRADDFLNNADDIISDAQQEDIDGEAAAEEAKAEAEAAAAAAAAAGP